MRTWVRNKIWKGAIGFLNFYLLATQIKNSIENGMQSTYSVGSPGLFRDSLPSDTLIHNLAFTNGVPLYSTEIPTESSSLHVDIDFRQHHSSGTGCFRSFRHPNVAPSSGSNTRSHAMRKPPETGLSTRHSPCGRLITYIRSLSHWVSRLVGQARPLT